MNSADFYDNFIDYQIESGINDRIAGLYNRLCKTGLSTRSNVLEIGCGIGTLTYLLLKKVRTGSVESVDISPKSIAFAQKHLKAANLSFHTADILGFEPQQKLFDRILLFDVLEHIPLGQHAEVFQRISKWMNDDSLLLINIPNPAYILHDQQKNPAALQETDQPVYLAPLSAALDSAALDILSVETYSVWVKEDYELIIARKRRAFKERLLSDERNFFQKVAIWFTRRWRKMKHPYPTKPARRSAE